MELAFVIWAVGTLPAIATGMCFILFWPTLLGFLTWIGCNIGVSCEKTEDGKGEIANVGKVARNVFLVSFPLWFVFLLVPDKTTAYQMLAAYGVQSVVENPKAQELANDGVDVLKALMAKAKKELEDGTK